MIKIQPMKYTLIIFLFASFYSFSQEPGEPELPEEPVEVEEVEEVVPYFVEVMPSFPGGEGAMRKFIIQHLAYPAIDIENGVQGKVFVRFIVSKDGVLSDFEILRGLSSTIDAECVRVLKRMPNWIPGETNGHQVKCYFTMPFTFKLG